MAMMHLHITLSADIFIQSGIIVIFPKFKMAAQDGGRGHLKFSDYVNLAIPACRQCRICVLYQIWFTYLL